MLYRRLLTEMKEMAPECVRALRDALQRQPTAVQLPYLRHSLAVARRLMQIGGPPESVCAAILHECYEQGLLRLEEVTQAYGPATASVLSDVEPLGRLFRGCDRLQHLEELADIGLPLPPEAVNCLWGLLAKLPVRYRAPLAEELEALTGCRPRLAPTRGKGRYRRMLVRRGLSSDLNGA